MLLPCLVLAIHTPALGAYFEADDFLWVIHHDWHDGLAAIFGNWGLGLAWRPLTRLSFLLDARLFGWNAWPWHGVNLALHALNAMLVAVLAAQAGARRWNALLMAGLFAAMPVDWENVDWISGRTGEWCLLFLLLSALFWLRNAQLRHGLVLSCLCLAMAMLAYEPAAILPLALLAALPALIPRAEWRRALASAAILAVTALAIWLLRGVLLGTAGVATDVAATHFLPNLGMDLLRLGAHAWRDFGPAGCVATVSILVTGCMRRQTRRTALCLLLAAACLYVPFTPVAGFTERFLYLATVPVAALLMVALAPWRWGRAAACLLVLIFAARSHAQAEGFRRAGALTRAILAHIEAIPDDGRNLVFDGVPTHDGPYYLLWANFEDAVPALRASTGFAVTTEFLVWHPDLVRRALGAPTGFYLYRPADQGFTEIPAAVWRQRHGFPPASAKATMR